MHFKSSSWSLLCALLLGVGTLFVPRPAQAFFCAYDYTYTQTFYGLCITEITQGMNNFEWVGSTILEGQKLTEWKANLEKQRERYNQLNPGNYNLGETTGTRVKLDDLKERSESYNVNSLCKKFKGRSRVAEEQKMICTARQQLVNKRYNVLVQMLKDAEKRDQNVAEIRSNRGSINGAKDSGRLAANTNTAMQARAGTVNDGQNYITTMQMYTTMIATLDREMAKSANKALKNEGAEDSGPFGLPPIVGKVVQGAALKIGLAAAESRDL
ncbi:hypothetical protein ACI2IY_15180 [Lysobacter enzymogenes]|uniref:hypothetical protein n=1 Tax=Lysobacter enzymogenes TaxID=69 RepID=UPI00384D80BD